MFAQNPTRMFNIYGITEVSCWATCHEIALPTDTTRADDSTPVTTAVTINSTGVTINSTGVAIDSIAVDMVPIGECLRDTSIELRDQVKTDNGVEGTLWIGWYTYMYMLL